MKIKITISILLIGFFSSFGQISVSSRHIKKAQKIHQKNWKKLIKSKTVFVVPKTIDKETYTNILNEAWQVTPFSVLYPDEFDINNYLSDRYSFFIFNGYKKIDTYIKTYERNGHTYNGRSQTITYLRAHFILYMLDMDVISKKIKKAKKIQNKEKRERKINKAVKYNHIEFAYFPLFIKPELADLMLKEEEEKIVKKMVNENVFYNFNAGFFKNYVQKINDLIKKQEIYWLYKNDYLPELKNLSAQKLYVPEYIGKKYHPFKAGSTGVEQATDNNSEAYIKDIFNNYPYSYEIISSENLNRKIMNREAVYYMRYVRENSDRFLNIVNARTGEVVYRRYLPLGYNLKSKQINHLKKSIKKASKKT